MCIYVDVCLYLYVYIHIYIYTYYLYIYIYTHMYYVYNCIFDEVQEKKTVEENGLKGGEAGH